MTYSVRLMCNEDIAQAREIDREVFYFQWPPPDFRRELESKLTRYIVICDTTKTAQIEPAVNSSLINRIKQWLGRSGTTTDQSPAPRQDYIVGFAGIWVVADESHLTNIAVRSEYQSRGIGELLLTYSLELAKELRAGFMTLEVRVSNTTAQNLYSKYGFTHKGLRKGYYHDNKEDAIIMSTESFNTASFQRKLQKLKRDHASRWGKDYARNSIPLHPK